MKFTKISHKKLKEHYEKNKGDMLFFEKYFNFYVFAKYQNVDTMIIEYRGKSYYLTKGNYFYINNSNGIAFTFTK